MTLSASGLQSYDPAVSGNVPLSGSDAPAALEQAISRYNEGLERP